LLLDVGGHMDPNHPNHFLSHPSSMHMQMVEGGGSGLMSLESEEKKKD